MQKLCGSVRAVFLSAVFAISMFGGASAWGALIEVDRTFHYRDTRTASVFGPGGDYLGISAYVRPNPYTDPVNGVATTVTISQGSVTNLPLFYVPSTFPGLTDQYGRLINYDPNLTGAWTITVSNPFTVNDINNPVVVQTNGVEGVNALPFVKSVSMTGSGTDVVVNWTQPESDRVSGYGVAIWDLVKNDWVHIENVPAGTTSFQIPQTFQSGDSLTLGANYMFLVQASEIKDIDGTPTFVAASRTFVNFTPTAGPVYTDEIFLPTVDQNGNFNFNVDVSNANELLFFDPVVAIGYDFLIGPGNPNFASILLPDIGDGVFSLWLLNELGDAFGSPYELLAGIEYDFLGPTSGVGLSRFRILGIEPSAGLDPGDVTAFVTGLSFVSAGEFTGQMRPIVAEVANAPEPSTLTLFGLGVAGIYYRRRKREA